MITVHVANYQLRLWPRAGEKDPVDHHRQIRNVDSPVIVPIAVEAPDPQEQVDLLGRISRRRCDNEERIGIFAEEVPGGVHVQINNPVHIAAVRVREHPRHIFLYHPWHTAAVLVENFKGVRRSRTGIFLARDGIAVFRQIDFRLVQTGYHIELDDERLRRVYRFLSGNQNGVVVGAQGKLEILCRHCNAERRHTGILTNSEVVRLINKIEFQGIDPATP